MVLKARLGSPRIRGADSGFAAVLLKPMDLALGLVV